MTTASILLSCFLSQASIPPFAPGEAPISGDTVAPEMQGVDIVEHLGDIVPPHTLFMGDDGNEVSLGKILESGKPIMLHMGYYKCPMLCTLVLNEGFRSLAKVDLSVGKDFELVSISVNPKESNELAHAKKLGYLAEYGREGAERGVRFLTAIQTPQGAAAPAAIAEAIGFQYKQLPSGEYSHPAMFAMIAADGRIVRYLYGVKFDPDTMRMALVEAGEGKIGTPLDRFILWCHQYDPSSQGYVLFAFRVMQVGGGITVVVLAAGLIYLFRRGARAQQLSPIKEVSSVGSQPMSPRVA
ncbi:MAG: SCO family protein [Phycisphaerales bacterium]|nr:SCO family protein [Phycisphaerales bacterium]